MTQQNNVTISYEKNTENWSVASFHHSVSCFFFCFFYHGGWQSNVIAASMTIIATIVQEGSLVYWGNIYSNTIQRDRSLGENSLYLTYWINLLSVITSNCLLDQNCHLPWNGLIQHRLKAGLILCNNIRISWSCSGSDLRLCVLNFLKIVSLVAACKPDLGMST